MCLDDPNDSSAANTAVDIATCLNVAGQYWTVPATGHAGQIKINGRCLDTARGSTAKGAGVVLATCSIASTQQWAQGAGNRLINVHRAYAEGWRDLAAQFSGMSLPIIWWPSRRVVVGTAESCGVTEDRGRMPPETLRHARTLRRADGNPPR